jgi:N6-L-threonylcarbamoyladenine synthase
MFILGIESSCDDTGAAVVEAQADGRFTVRANVIRGQDHTRTGGVVPEVAARHHATAILPAIDEALATAGVRIDQIDAIAVTHGPGLIACLLVGVETARTLAASRNIPLLGVNHMAGHIASTFVEHPTIAFPAVVLLASGGHTMLVGMQRAGHYFLIGETRDDAAGEAFDKVAKMLDLPYPGGPQIATLAPAGNPQAHAFPWPMIDSEDFDFSFAGLKTAVLYHLRDHPPRTEQDRADVAASFQEAVVQVLVSKTLAAAKLHNAKTIILGGGVSANRALQDRLTAVAAADLPDVQVVIPSPGLFTDNGAMIAIAAAPRALAGDFDDWQNLGVNPKLRLTE